MISKKQFSAIVAGLLVVAIIGWFLPRVPMAGGGSLALEDYDGGYLRQNGGYSSALPITLTGASGDITSGDDITAGDDLVVTDDATISGGLLSITTSNTATSSIAVGCIQINATSTASPGRLLFNTQATTTISGTAAGAVAWGYGTCPF